MILQYYWNKNFTKGEKVNVKTKTNTNQLIKKLRDINTETLAKLLPWITLVLIAFFIIFYFIIGQFFVLELGDQINFLLSSTIAIFAFIEGFSTYIQARLEKDRNRLQQIRDELEKVYGQLYSIFYKKSEYVTAREFVFINAEEKRRIDNVFMNYPFLIVPLTLSIWQNEIERLEPYKTEPETTYAIPMYFISNITIQYDELTDEYHRRTGKELLDKSNFQRRLQRFKF